MNIEIIPERAFKYLAAVISVLMLANVIAIYLKFNSKTVFANAFFKLFDVNTESNIPSLYSTITLFVCAILLFLIHFIENSKQKKLGYWSFLGLIFLFLAVDENIELHERIMGLVRNTFHLTGFFYYAWIVPYFLAVFLLGCYYLPFLLKLPRSIMYHFIIAFTLFIGGAVGMEMIGGRHDSLYGQDVILAMYYSIEELLEMLGIAVFIKGLLLYLIDSKASGKLKFKVLQEPKTVMQTIHEEV